MMLLSQEPRGDGDLLFETNTNGNSGNNGINGTDGDVHYHDLATEAEIPLHPLGIKPLGNLYLASGPNARNSIGTLQALPDEMLAILLEYFDQLTVRRLSYTCKFLSALCSSDDVWKALFLE